MSRLPLPSWIKVTGLGLPATGGTSWLIHLAGVPMRSAVVISAAFLALLVLAKIFESVATMFESFCQRWEDVIRAKSEGKALISRTRTNNKLAVKGMKTPQKTRQAERMLRMRALSADLPEHRRLPDDVLDRQLALPKSRTTSKKPSTPPKDSGEAPSTDSGIGRVVLPFQPPDDLPTRRSRRSPNRAGTPSIT